MVPADGKRRTSDRILDIAEDFFAERGFDATSLGDVADRVGIRQPSLYNHFKNKKELYAAVLRRLLDPFRSFVENIELDGDMPERSHKLAGEIMAFYASQPNLPRMIQHAVLEDDSQLDLLIEYWFRPFTRKLESLTRPDDERSYSSEQQPFVLMAFNSIMFGYVTMAPLYRQWLGVEPLTPDAIRRQVEILDLFSRGLGKQ